MNESLPCKQCERNPIYPFSTVIKQKDGGFYIEYKFESQCDCPLTIGYTVNVYNDRKWPNNKEMEPLVEAWNKLNK